MTRITCPHCGKAVRVSASAFVTGREKVKGEFKPKDYHPDPHKDYRTSEKTRRTSLAWYWRNRAKVLKREKRRRQQLQQVGVSIHD